MTKYSLDISSLAPKIKEQLEKQNVCMTEENYEKYEKIRISITMLYYHISTPTETKNNWKRFFKKIEKDIYEKQE